MAVIAVFYTVANRNVKEFYLEELKVLDKKEYSYKDLLAFGMWLYDRLNIPASGSYYVFLYQRIVMVYGTRYAGFFMQVHWAEKFLYFSWGRLSLPSWGLFQIQVLRSWL